MIFREIIRELLLISRPIANKLDTILASFDLTLSNWKVIDFIERSGSCSLVGVASHLSIKKPSVTRTIDFLEGRKLVEEISGKDRREKRTRLTGLGKETYTRCRNVFDRTEQDLLKGISDKEQKTLLRFLTTIRFNLK